MNNSEGKRNIFGLFLLSGILLFGGNLFGQATSCSFWNEATYRGAPVTTSDIITAYNSSGQLCGETTGRPGYPGYYTIDVYGVYVGSPYYPAGANDGDAITFKINGETATVVSGSHIWQDKGSYECNLSVADQPPVSDPGGPYTGSEGSAVQFNGSGSSGSTYAWNFGDGNTGTEMSPSHTYTDNGNYTVTLTVSNASSQTDVNSTTATISNVNPVANAGSDKSSNEGESVSFSGSATDVGTEDTAQGFAYLWNFGDGGSAVGQTAAHTFTNNRTYTVTLTATDKDGGEGTDQLLVTVSNLPPQNVNAGSDQTGDEGQSLQFSGSATDPGSGDVLIYSWDFSDGSSGNGQTVYHAFGDNGTYTVTLTVSDGDASATDQLTVTVNNVVPVAHAGGPYTVPLNQAIQFSGSVTDPGTNEAHVYEWDLDNDSQFDDYTGRYPVKTYTAAGSYPISLKVTDKDGAWDTDGTTVSVTQGVAVTIKAQPEGNSLTMMVNGELYETPKVFHFQPGTQITVEAPMDQYISSTIRYHYLNWTTGGPRIQTFTIPENDVTWEANYEEHVWIEIDTRGVNATNTGGGWHVKGTMTTVDVEGEALSSDGLTKYIFRSWSGHGDGAYTGIEKEARFYVGGPIIQTVNWDEQYLLQVFSPVGTTSGSGWYAPGAEAIISVDEESIEDGGSRNYFNSWIGEGDGSYIGSDNPAVVTVNEPIIQTAVWVSQYKLDLVTDHGTVTGDGWYDAGSTAHVTIDTSLAPSEGTRLRFLRWQGVGTGSYTGPECEFDVVVNSPITEVAQWKTQYYLTLNSERGNPTGEGWYDKGQLVSWSIEQGVQISQDERYGFYRWIGEGLGSYTGTEREPSVVIQGPITEVAEWRGQYYVSTSVTPENSGTILGFDPPGGWGFSDTLNTFKAIGVADSGYGFFKWLGEVDSYINPLELYLDAPKTIIAEFIHGKIRIYTEPEGLEASVDGDVAISPMVFNWPTGEEHVISVPTPQGDQVTTKYNFREWSDGGALEHTVVSPDTATTYLANFDPTYYLNVESDYGVPVGEGWYTEGTQASVSIDSIVAESSRIQWKFTGWEGSGEGSLTTNNRNISLNIISPITEKASWSPQFTLKVDKFPAYAPGVEVTIDPAGPWYDPGQQVTLRAVINDPSYSFTGWSGDVEGSQPTLTVTVNSPLDIVANFYVPNLPPVISAFPAVFVAEDQVFEKSFQWLSQFINDDNNLLKQLIYEFDSEGQFEVVVDTVASVFKIIPKSQWSGEGNIEVTVTDPGGLKAQGSIKVVVMPVDDLPEPFSLLSPASDSVFTEWSWATTFLWEKSQNVDPGDSIMYTFYFSDSESFLSQNTFAASFIADTSLSVHIQTPGEFYWAVWAEDLEKKRTRCTEIFKISLDTDVLLKGDPVSNYELYQNYPNPFNPETRIRYALPQSGEVELKIYDMMGRLVCTLLEGPQSSGTHEVVWDGRDENEMLVSSGLYIIRIKAGSYIENRKMLLVR